MKTYFMIEEKYFYPKIKKNFTKHFCLPIFCVHLLLSSYNLNMYIIYFYSYSVYFSYHVGWLIANFLHLLSFCAESISLAHALGWQLGVLRGVSLGDFQVFCTFHFATSMYYVHCTCKFFFSMIVAHLCYACPGHSRLRQPPPLHRRGSRSE